MKYEWNSSLETGCEQVDRQHKLLIKTLNELQEAFEQGRGEQELQRAVEFMVAYTVKHFQDEEALQEEHKYPSYLEHKGYHNEFKRTVRDLVMRLDRTGYNETLVREVIEILAGWLTHHIKGDDFKMATYVMHSEKRKK